MIKQFHKILMLLLISYPQNLHKHLLEVLGVHGLPHLKKWWV